MAKKGLIVLLRAKRSDDDELLLDTITVKHYFVPASCSHGVSLVAKIRSDSGDGGLNVQLEKLCVYSAQTFHADHV